MPGLDGKGPAERGPAAGARGRCNPAGPVEYGNAAAEFPGRGRRSASGRGSRGCNGSGRGRGRGFGRGSGLNAPLGGQTPEDELNALRLQSDSLKNTLDAMKSRVAELEEKD